LHKTRHDGRQKWHWPVAMSSQPLLQHMASAVPAEEAAGGSRRRRRFPPLNGGADIDPTNVIGGCLTVFTVLIAVFFVATLDPNEFGLRLSLLTGEVDAIPSRGGLHILGPLSAFVRFPAAQQALEFSTGPNSDRPPIKARTGAGTQGGDAESGGQPISIYCAMQIQLAGDKLRDMYLAFGGWEFARERVLLIAGNEILLTTQEFSSQDFWTERAKISARMLRRVNSTIYQKCGVYVQRFQITRVQFAESFERSITSIQVAEQQRVVNEYDQQVQRVFQSIEVMRAFNKATIANISAGAEAQSKEICAGATRDAFKLKQTMKSHKYLELGTTLNLSAADVEEYFKIKAVQGGLELEQDVVVAVEGFEEPEP